MSKHTQGPWSLHWPSNDAHGQKFVVHAPDSKEFRLRPLALVEPNGDDFSQANAHLIASAPEMLEALKQVVAIYESGHSQRAELAKQYAQAAISKAEGRK